MPLMLHAIIPVFTHALLDPVGKPRGGRKGIVLLEGLPIVQRALRSTRLFEAILKYLILMISTIATLSFILESNSYRMAGHLPHNHFVLTKVSTIKLS